MLSRCYAIQLMAMALLAFSPGVHATDFDVSHLAAELNRVSADLAKELRNSRGYSSVRFSANQLSREAADLVAAISRNRSVSYQRSQFQNVVRHYRELERAFLRSSREHDRYVYNQVGVISNLFSGLNSEFYYTNYVEPAPHYYYTPPALGRRPAYSGRRVSGLGTAVPSIRTPAVGRSSGRVTIGVPANNFSHRSSVLDRQARQQYQLRTPAGVRIGNATSPR